MRRSLRFYPSLPVALVLAACSDTAATGILDSSNAGPTVFFSNAPPTSGPNIVRGVPLAVGAVDLETNLVVFAGFSETLTAANCANIENIPLSGELTQQQVSTPSGREQFTSPRQEVAVTVYQLVGEPTDLCSVVSGPIVATGTVTAVWGEKNVPPPGELGPGAGIQFVTLNGVVELTEGGQARLLAGFKVRFNTSGDFVSETDFVRLH